MLLTLQCIAEQEDMLDLLWLKEFSLDSSDDANPFFSLASHSKRLAGRLFLPGMLYGRISANESIASSVFGAFEES